MNQIAVPPNLRQRVVIQFNIEKTTEELDNKFSQLKTTKHIPAESHQRQSSCPLSYSCKNTINKTNILQLSDFKNVFELKLQNYKIEGNHYSWKKITRLSTNLQNKTAFYNMATNYTCFLLKSITGKLNTLQLLWPIFLTSYNNIHQERNPEDL